MTSSTDLKNLLSKRVVALKRPKLSDEAASKLRELILLAELPPGTLINERDLSEVLGVSRTPIREAISELEREGLVDYSATRRPRVADPSMEQLTQWLMVQSALEGLAGELACVKASAEELDHIAQLHLHMIEQAESDDRLARFKLDMAFHTAIVAAAHNPALAETHAQYNARLWRARFISSQLQSNREVQMRKHQDIVDALVDRNVEKAATALRTHLVNAVDNIAFAKQELAEAS